MAFAPTDDISATAGPARRGGRVQVHRVQARHRRKVGYIAKEKGQSRFAAHRDHRGSPFRSRDLTIAIRCDESDGQVSRTGLIFV